MAVHLKNMTALRTLQVDFDGGHEEFSPSALAILLQSIPPSVKTLYIDGFHACVQKPFTPALHLCPILARAISQIEDATLIMRGFCPTFFTSVDAFPNLKELHIRMYVGWHSCRKLVDHVPSLWPEGLEEFKQTVLKNLHKMPQLKKFSIQDEVDQEGPISMVVGKLAS
ncbi:hypothetical protein HDV00_002161 [Rhizophlyctis rosea]|nr:hypothetical protein HDV00_002161 [Rhizophlyctis rosea]